MFLAFTLDVSKLRQPDLQFNDLAQMARNTLCAWLPNAEWVSILGLPSQRCLPRGGPFKLPLAPISSEAGKQPS